MTSDTIDRLGSVDPYCEITVGSLALRTPFIKRTINPKWNAPMQFLLYDFHEDLIHISIFDHEFFSPNGSSRLLLSPFSLIDSFRESRLDIGTSD